VQSHPDSTVARQQASKPAHGLLKKHDLLHYNASKFHGVAVAVSACEWVCLWLAGAQLARRDLLDGTAMHHVPGSSSFPL